MKLEKTKDFSIVRLGAKELIQYLGLDSKKHLFVSLSVDPMTEDITIVTSNETGKE